MGDISDTNDIDIIRDRLHRAGWSLGETGTPGRVQIDGSNGENKLYVVGPYQLAAWRAAFVSAPELGLVARLREG